MTLKELAQRIGLSNPKSESQIVARLDELRKNEFRLNFANEAEIDLIFVNDMPVGPDNWVMVSPFGTFPNVQGNQCVTKEDAENLVNVFRNSGAQSPGLCVFQGHPDHPNFADRHLDPKAYGRVTELKVKPDGLWANVRWSTAGKQMINEKMFHAISVNWRVQRKSDGLYHPIAIKSFGLTCQPNLPVQPITHANETAGDPGTAPSPKSSTLSDSFFPHRFGAGRGAAQACILMSRAWGKVYILSANGIYYFPDPTIPASTDLPALRQTCKTKFGIDPKIVSGPGFEGQTVPQAANQRKPGASGKIRELVNSFMAGGSDYTTAFGQARLSRPDLFANATESTTASGVSYQMRVPTATGDAVGSLSSVERMRKVGELVRQKMRDDQSLSYLDAFNQVRDENKTLFDSMTVPVEASGVFGPDDNSRMPVGDAARKARLVKPLVDAEMAKGASYLQAWDTVKAARPDLCAVDGERPQK